MLLLVGILIGIGFMMLVNFWRSSEASPVMDDEYSAELNNEKVERIEIPEPKVMETNIEQERIIESMKAIHLNMEKSVEHLKSNSKDEQLEVKKEKKNDGLFFGF